MAVATSPEGAGSPVLAIKSVQSIGRGAELQPAGTRAGFQPPHRHPGWGSRWSAPLPETPGKPPAKKRDRTRAWSLLEFLLR